MLMESVERLGVKGKLVKLNLSELTLLKQLQSVTDTETLP